MSKTKTFCIAESENDVNSDDDKDSTELQTLKSENDESPLMPSTKACPVISKAVKPNFIKWTISNCADLNGAFEFFAIRDANLDLSQIDNVLFVQIIIDNKFEEPNQIQIEGLSEKFASTSVVILFMSKCYDAFYIYWKSKYIKHILSIQPFTKKSVCQYKELYKFIVDTLIHSLIQGHLGIDKSPVIKQSEKIEIKDLVDSSNFNLLQLSAELGEVEIVKMLLELDIFVDELNNLNNAQSLAYYCKKNDVLLVLLQANFSYPKAMNISECSDDIRKFQVVSEKIHKAIRTKKAYKVLGILKNNSKQKHYYNLLNTSALKASLDRKAFNIYEILLSHNITFGPHENFSEIFGHLDNTDRDILCKIHFRQSKDLPENHIDILMINSFCSYDESKKEKKKEYIRQAYEFLDQEPNMRCILKTVAASRRFKIVFDFNRESTNAVIPSTNQYSRGMFYKSRKICVGAKQLLDSNTEHETLGTLAHELTHYAVDLTYDNLAKPYFSCDRESKEEFKRVVEFCRINRHEEEIINQVYSSYTSDKYHAELIVRAPHLMALYDKNQTDLQQRFEVYSCLFKYFTEKVIPDMINAFSLINDQAANEMAEKNKKIWNLRKKFYFSIVFIFFIATFLSYFFYDPIYSFDKLTIRNQIRVKDTIVIYMGVEVKFRNLFNDSSGAWNSLTSNHIKQILEGKSLNFSDPQIHYLNKQVNLDWIRLPYELESKILNSYIIFQNATVMYKHLNYKALETLSFEQILYILNGGILTIGQGETLKDPFYLERHFIPDDTKLIYSHYKLNTEGEKVFKIFYEEFQEIDLPERVEIINPIKEEEMFKSDSKNYDLSNETFKFIYKNSSEVIKIGVNERIFILSSEAGMGKTATSKKLTNQIKKKFPTRWVSYIDLKTGFSKNDSMNLKIFLENILKLNSVSKFERALFWELYKSDKVVLIWNGFDEIPSAFRDWVLNKTFGTIYKNSKNIQFINTRSLFSEQLSENLNISGWNLVPFNESEQNQFILKYFESRNLSKKDSERSLNIFTQITKKLEYDGNSVRKLNTPLMLKMIAEVFLKYNLTESGSLYKVYEHFIAEKLQIWKEKDSVINNSVTKMLGLPKFNLMDIYQKYGLLNEFAIFLSTTFALKLKKLDIIQKTIPIDVSYEEISSMGIICIYGEHQFEFLHKTFSEFFVAQYFIQNIYLADNTGRIEEFELRLDIFFLITKKYGHGQRIITDFIKSYIEDNNHDPLPFSSTISKLVRTKFKNFFLNLLDTDYPIVFDFLINFFKKDRELLVDLLHVHSDETFYTAIFNPNYFSIFADPENIKNLTRNILTKTEFEIFIEGQDQRGKNIYGTNFYKLINEANLNETNSSVYSTKFWNSIREINFTLTFSEQKKLFKVAASPKIYLHYDILFNSTNLTEYEQLWENYENLLTNEEIKEIIASCLMDYLKFPPVEQLEYLKHFFLPYILNKAVKFLSNSEIYDMYLTKNFLHAVQTDEWSFNKLWNFLKNHSSEIERREILIQNDLENNYFFSFPLSNDTRKKFCSHFYNYFYYDYTNFNLLQKSLTVNNLPTFNLTAEIYSQYFNNSDIQKFFLNSNDVLYYSIAIETTESFKIFPSYLGELFKGNERLLVNYLNKTILPTMSSIFKFVEDLKFLEGSQERWFENLESVYELYNKNMTKN